MSQEKKIDVRNIIILISIFLIIIIVLTRFEFLYGSTLDWQTQHWTFAEYFRQLFYQDFNLFPSFAFNIGAGQNIYNLSYYGFLNPIILLSYFFPFIKMVDYIMLTSIFSLATSIILFYKWLRQNKINVPETFVTSLIFLLASPLILHSHRHIMFVNYLPFLILGLISIDRYFKDGKRSMLILSTFLLIMTSYYYSIPSLFVFVIYGIYKFIQKEKIITIKLFFQEGFKFLIPIFIGILMSSILLFPTLYSILNSRGSLENSLNLATILLPKVNLGNLLYSSYSVGLTSIMIYSLSYGLISKKKEIKFISIIISILTIFPIFIYLLNGALYLNAKVLIPFTPLCCYLIAKFFQDLFKNKVTLSKTIIITLIISLLAYLTTNWSNMNKYLIDMFIILLMLLLYHFKKIKIGLLISTVAISLIVCLDVNLNDELMLQEDYNYIFSADINELYNTINEDENIYRSSNLVDQLVTTNKVYNPNYYNTSIYSSAYNSYYKDFYYNTFNNPIPYRNHLILNQVDSILWNTYMGIKYLITDKTPPLGYEEIKTINNYTLYKNNNVFPIGYANSKLMSTKEFSELSYPYNIEALLNYTIIDSAPPSNFKSTIKDYQIEHYTISNPNLKITKENNHYQINASKDTEITIPLPSSLTNEILIIRFNMNYEQACSKGDTSITINGIKNTLTCKSWKYKNQNNTFDYVISSNEDIKELNVIIKKGYYDISNIKSYTLSYDNIKSLSKTTDTFNLTRINGDVLEGTINVKEDGYFNISLPYDEGFKIYLNDELVTKELVNTSFIGFPLKKGNHKIKIEYQAPLKNASLILSSLGLGIFILIIVLDKKKEVKENAKRKN